MSLLHFTVSLPTDEGYIGRECKKPDCSRYFRIHGDDVRDTMFCAYCGTKGSKDEFLTRDQLRHARNVAKEKAMKYAHDEFNNMLKRAFGRSRSNSLIKFTVRTTPYRERSIYPNYREREVDSALLCHDCNTRFQVDGIFGFCPGCKAEQMRVYDADLAIIKQELERASDSQRALRHAYGDLVSTFELLCRRRALKITQDSGRFQNLSATRRFFEQYSGVDVLACLGKSEWLSLRRLFQKRHLFAHGTHVIDDRYVAEVPEDAKLLGEVPTLSLSEFEIAANAVRKIIDGIVIRTQ